MNATMDIGDCDIKIDFDGTRIPLMVATSAGYIDIVSCLITHGADVNARSASCNTYLIYGCAGHEEIVRILLDSGADVEDHTEDGHTPLMVVASAGHVEEVVRILLDWGANVDTMKTVVSWTPLMEAAGV
ncbi:PREDICTED: protein fem-1 homolog C-like [Acromyrmex echinatior]|uniref:protein fem-1 homolog C-like n=1 Tax=Acromyrmex echinatior TaxID=103372 RepID=UPI000580B976|nr:PREDICTED: protein fem-1 homolog C-like [Acromyrmex echinatior]